jgi:NADH-quinone oxidoreductase subunit I
MKNALVEFYNGVKSLFIGLKITIGQFFRPIVTVQYPHETLKIPKRFRGHIELVRDPGTGKAKCFVCKLCEKACPSDCITVEGIKPEGARRKTVTYYRLDFTKCSLCGSCVEACRDSAIRFSREYNLASTSKEDFIMDLFKRLETEGNEGPVASQADVQNPKAEIRDPKEGRDPKTETRRLESAQPVAGSEPVNNAVKEAAGAGGQETVEPMKVEAK